MESFIFSIIIPHKNIPDLLQRCLDSIPRREDIQIIVVDDNSDENQVDFNNFPGLNDKHVELYLTKEGKGAGYARNVGLIHAKGKWLLFADADDFFTENAFNLFFAYKDSFHDIIYFKVTSCYSDTYEPANRCDRTNQLIESFFHQKNDAENKLRCGHRAPWGKMIKTELVNKNEICFDEVLSADDMMFSTVTSITASSVNVVNAPVYCTTVRKGSIEHTSSYEKLLSRYLVFLRVNEFLRKKGKHKYQNHTIQHIYFSTKYGIIPFFHFIGLSIRYRNNPFIGIGGLKGVTSYLKMRKYRSKNKKYFVSE
jgi:glycosyltransferase involved in cell wall biosynthesis